ncbi:MAG: SPOR domain-containing protein [Sedimentitalea sp.]
MADIEYTQDVIPQDVGSQPEPNGLGAWINVVGAAASLALVVGLGYWGYQLVMRDVSGVPVVRALEGPMRVQPAEPGGRPADHQGLAVNAVAAEGTAEAPADRLLLAPRPIELEDEDAPMGQLLQDADEASIEALVKKLTDGVAPLESITTETTQESNVEATLLEPETEVTPEPAVLTGPGLPRSLRPQVRPASLQLSSQPAPVASAQSVQDVDPDSLPVGTRLAQLGAYDSPEIAKAEWDRLAASFQDYMGDKPRVIQKASSGGRTFYRLRAMGFDDLSEARRFCSVLVAENADCIPVTTR